MSNLDVRYLRRLCGADCARIRQSLTALEADDSITPNDKAIIKQYYEQESRKAERQYDLLGQISPHG